MIRQENGMMIPFRLSGEPFKAGDKVTFEVAKEERGFVAVDVKPTTKRYHY